MDSENLGPLQILVVGFDPDAARATQLTELETLEAVAVIDPNMNDGVNDCAAGITGACSTARRCTPDCR